MSMTTNMSRLRGADQFAALAQEGKINLTITE